MKSKKENIINILLKNKRVNNYTKLLIYLSRLNYYKDDYIPNKKLMNMLNINKQNLIRRLLKQLEDDKIIKIFYKGRKRYFKYIINTVEDIEDINDEENINNNRRIELFDYDWLNDPEVRNN